MQNPSTIYDIVFNNKVVSRLNKDLVMKQDVLERVPDIIAAHVKKMQIFDAMNQMEGTEENSPLLKELNIKAVYIEKELQKLWKFPYNENYFKFWETPHCTCPKLDNRDNYPTGPYFYFSKCLIHS